MPRINFVFAIHFHQPTGQLKWVNDRVYENSYKLLLEIFREYSDLKFTIHISGPLLLYMKEYYPEWINEMAKLGDYGTFEFLAGSYGESILPLLPDSDRVNQVREYIRLFEKLFGYKPKGFWLPERVWEPSLPKPLAVNGIEYVLIDDSTLYRSGRGEPDNYYVWLTEDNGYGLKIFFIDTGIRYVLPWRSSGEVIDYMLSKSSGAGDRVIVWGSDAEKFGEWRDREWARNWLRDFLENMRIRRQDIAMIHPSEYISEHGVHGLLYLASGSYDKMLEWSNGFFRNFLVKYRESNNMHKKMLWVRRKLVSLKDDEHPAWKHYYLAQCNDPYWHGLFGGIYLSHLRQAVYEEYIVAEKMVEETLKYYEETPLIHYIDFDYDGEYEYLYETPEMNLYIKPGDGGTVFEQDIKIDGYEHNLQDTMTRYWEPYLEGTGFKPDWYRRVSSRIHLWSTDTMLDDWINNTPFKDRSDLALKKYEAITSEDGKLLLRTIGGFYGGRTSKVFVEKTISLLKTGYVVDYMLENIGEETIEAKLGIEYHIAPKIDREHEDSIIQCIVDGKHSVEEKWIGYTDKLIIRSPGYRDIVLEQRGFDEIWVSPLNSLARTEKGLKEIFQGIAVMFIKNIRLERGEEERYSVKQYLDID